MTRPTVDEELHFLRMLVQQTIIDHGPITVWRKEHEEHCKLYKDTTVKYHMDQVKLTASFNEGD